MNGRPTVKSKKAEFIPKIAVAIHVMEFSFGRLFQNREIDFIPQDIKIQTLKKSILFLEKLEEQKDLFFTINILTLNLH